MMDGLGWLALALTALPAGLVAANLRLLRDPAAATEAAGRLVSILIPARNEAEHIGPAVEAARASAGVPVEILVMDDGSTDRTAEIVRRCGDADERVRLLAAPPLPSGWSGKAHACQRLAEAARGTHLLFVDADVRLAPDAAARLAGHADATGSAMVSGVPREVMGTLGELLTVPMINFLLLAYLPLSRMRAGTQPSLGAACGQLLLVDSAAYRRVGGHAAVRGAIHDALMLARAFRAKGLPTDLVRGTDLATCRMYEAFAPALAGFSKNAREGMAKPVALPVWTVLLAGGHLLPPVLVLAALAGGAPLWTPLLALLLSLGSRAAVTLHARESLLTIPLHPLTVLTALVIQWTALIRAGRGRPETWKGRAYHAG